ncbi:MAG TPA: thiolase family protein [Mycobacteriales bacterium]|nr:thiolase family protein [Mycobacteriales bacterium]
MSDHEAVIVSAARTAVATANKGTLVDVEAKDLASHVVKAAVERSGIDPAAIDDIVLGESLYGGGVTARYAAIEAGLVNAPGIALNRHCATGLTALSTAAGSVMAGMDRVVVAGGVQSSSLGPRFSRRVPGTADDIQPWFPFSHPEQPDAPSMDMSITVGWNAAVKGGLTREDQDAWAYRSHQRAIAGIDAGAFVEEIVPLEVKRRDGTTVTFAVDEHPRRETTLEKLASLKVLHPEIEGFSITAGNASGVNDGAAALVIAEASAAKELGATPLAIIKSWASVGVDPADTGLAPPAAILRALDRANLKIGDVDLIEVNEAFASVAVNASRELKLDEEMVNPLGSGCSIGHPIAMTGARMVISLLYELRRRGGGIGVASMCAGGGMGSALVFEVPAP